MQNMADNILRGNNYANEQRRNRPLTKASCLLPYNS